VPDRFSLKAAAVDQKIMAGHRRPKARPRPSAESEISASDAVMRSLVLHMQYGSIPPRWPLRLAARPT
jgi:hypothetical protein